MKIFVWWSCKHLAGAVKHWACCLNVCYNLCAFVWEGKETLLKQECYHLEALHSNLTRSKTVPAVAQHGAAHLVDEEGKTYMVQKSPSQFSQRIAPKIWEEQDGIKSTTQSSPEYACDQTVISLYSAGSWDGDRCQDLTSHCVNGVGKWLNF